MIGRTLGTYRIIEKVGTGGMATVYKAYDANTDRHVAIKVLPEYHAKDSEFYERFRREARAIARLEHLNILPVFAFGEEEGTAYLVMRYLPTGTLSERIRQGKMPYDEISRLLKQIASALDYAHEQGVLHRDVKPSNVLLDERGNAYLTDFGLARMVESTSDLTGSNMLGTPQYMSPEQCQGRKDLMPASDIYSLGVVLYEMVTGQTPFQAETPLAVIHMQLSEPLPAPRSLRPDVPESVENVIYKAMAKQPDARHQTCMAMSDAFDKAIAALPKAEPEPPKLVDEPDTVVGRKAVTLPDGPTAVFTKAPSLAIPPSSRVPLWGIGIGVLLILLVLGVLASGVLNPPTTPVPTQVAAAPSEVTAEVTDALSQSAATAAATVEATPTPITPDDTATPTPTETAASTEVATESATQETTAFAENMMIGGVLEHGAPVYAVAINLGGSYAASGDTSGTVRLTNMNLETQADSADLGADAAVLDLAFSPDGRWLAAGTADGIRLWNVFEGSLELVYTLQAGVVRSVAFSPDNQYLIFGGDDLLLWVYRINEGTDGEVVVGMEGHTSSITSVDFSPDGTTIASGGGTDDGRVVLWDVESQSITRIIETDAESVASVSFNHDGTRLAVATTELLIYDTATGEQLNSGYSGIYTAAYATDGSLIAVSYEGGTIGMVDPETMQEVRQVTGHTATVRALAFNGSMTRLISGSDDGTARFWYRDEFTVEDVNDESARVLRGHSDAALAVAFSPDGRLVVTGSADSTVRVWDAATGEELMNIPLDEQQIVEALAFSPDGRFLAAGGVRDVRLWLVDTLTDPSASPINTLEGGVVRSVAFSPDSQYLIYGGDDMLLMVYRVNDGTNAELMYSLEGHTRGINDVAFSPDGITMASAGGYEDGRVILWDLPSHGTLHVLESGDISVDSVTFSPDGLRVAASTSAGVQIWDVLTGAQLMTVNTGSYGATYSPDGRLIATAYDGGMIGLVNAQTGEEITQLTGHTGTVFDLAFSPDGATLASASFDRTIRLWSVDEYLADIPTPTATAAATVGALQIEPNSEVFNAELNTLGLSISPGNNRIAIGASDGMARLWSVESGEIVTLNAGDQMLAWVDFSPSGAMLATAGVGSVRIWDVRNHRQIFAVESGVVDVIAFSPDNQTFAFGGDEDVVEVWSLATRERIYAFADATSDIEGLSYSPNGTQLAASGGWEDGNVRIYDLTSGELVTTLDTGTQAAYDGTFSPDGSLIAAATGDGGVIVWDVASGEQIVLSNFTGYGLTFSPDSTLIATGDDSSIITLWDARTGEEVRTFSGHTQRIESLAFYPDGTFLVSTSEDATVRVWDLRGDE